MISVYVKHYLNEAGKAYFDDTWYPYVKERIRQQQGFISIAILTEDLFCNACVNIIVTFENHEMLMAWVEHPDHQKIVHDLDVYRTKGQRWHVSVDGSVPDWS